MPSPPALTKQQQRGAPSFLSSNPNPNCIHPSPNPNPNPNPSLSPNPSPTLSPSPRPSPSLSPSPSPNPNPNPNPNTHPNQVGWAARRCSCWAAAMSTCSRSPRVTAPQYCQGAPLGSAQGRLLRARPLWAVSAFPAREAGRLTGSSATASGARASPLQSLRSRRPCPFRCRLRAVPA